MIKYRGFTWNKFCEKGLYFGDCRKVIVGGRHARQVHTTRHFSKKKELEIMLAISWCGV
jgi:hypothetical protein